jgi:probable F420-dependent oxidoreductase
VIDAPGLAGMTLRPFRFAVQAHKAAAEAEAVTAAGWRDLARAAEDLGYSTLHVADHYLDRGRAPQHLAPIAAMATAAAVTSTLRVGSRVFCVDYHVPAVLAKEAATLDLLSDGRLELGLGAGWSEVEYAAMGLTFEAAPTRVTKLEEVIALVKAHFSGEDLDCHGEHVNVAGYAGLPLPAQRPHPPIMVGGGRRRVLSIAAREADIVSLSNVPFTPLDEAGRTPQQVAAQRLEHVREAAGERFTQLEIETSPYFTEITARPDDAVARVAAWFDVPAEGLLDHPNVLIGTEDDIVDRLLHRREAFGVSYVTVPQSELEHFAPVVSRLTGT